MLQQASSSESILAVATLEGDYEREKILASTNTLDFKEVGPRAIVEVVREAVRIGHQPDIPYVLEKLRGTPNFAQVSATLADYGMSYAWESHLDLFRDRVAKQKILDGIASIQREAKDISHQEMLSKIGKLDDGTSTLEDDGSWDEAFESIINPPEYTKIPTCFSGLNDSTGGGLSQGEFVILAGRPGMGKTALAASLCAGWMRDGRRVALFSLEMPKRQMVARLLASLTSLPAWKIQHKINSFSVHDRAAINDHYRTLKGSGIGIYSLPSPTPEQIRAQVIREIRKPGPPLEVVIVDHIGLMDGATAGKNTRNDEVGHISRSLKKICQEFPQLIILALCQLNRDVEKTSNRKPELHHLRDSGSIEQDATMVLFVHRENHYELANPELKNQEGQEAKIIVAKNRDGLCGECHTRFFPSSTTFRD